MNEFKVRLRRKRDSTPYDMSVALPPGHWCPFSDPAIECEWIARNYLIREFWQLANIGGFKTVGEVQFARDIDLMRMGNFAVTRIKRVRLLVGYM